MKDPILIASQANSDSRVVAAFFERHGYPILMIEDGFSALESVLSKKTSLVFVSSSLKRLGGKELLGVLLQRSQVSQVPIVCLYDEQMNGVIANQGKNIFTMEVPVQESELEGFIQASSHSSKRGVDPQSIREMLRDLPESFSKVDEWWKSYQISTATGEFQVLIPDGSIPSDLVDLSDTGIEKQIKVLKKSHGQWRQLWPPQD